MIKKIIGITVILTLILTVNTACGGGNGEIKEEGAYRYEAILDEVLDIQNNPVYIAFETTYMDESVNVELYIKDNSVRIDTVDKEAGKISLISTGDGNFAVYQEYGFYIKTDEKAEAEDFLSFIKKDLDNYEVTVSEVEMMGETLEAETLKGNDGEISFYFLGNIWVAISIKEGDSETLMNIKSVTNHVSDEVFLIDDNFLDMTGAF